MFNLKEYLIYIIRINYKYFKTIIIKLFQLSIKMVACKQCKTTASFGIKDEKPSYCFKHKLANMINLKKRKSNKCLHENCNKNPNSLS